jgi:RNA polymerase sigma-70 factor (ECF subfamily)
LANWLYGVACRIARKARLKMTRDAARERCAVNVSLQEKWLDIEWDELKQALDEEVSQLPEKYRAPLVLCYLQGQTNAQAASQLGWPLGSISERLSQAREMLRRRLNRRGMNFTAALLTVLLTEKAASAAVPPVLVSATVKMAMLDAARKSAADTVAHSVLELLGKASGYSIWNAAKLLGVSAVILISIVSIGRSQGLIRGLGSVIPGWSGSDSYGSGSSCASSSQPTESSTESSTPILASDTIASENGTVNDVVTAGAKKTTSN